MGKGLKECDGDVATLFYGGRREVYDVVSLSGKVATKRPRQSQSFTRRKPDGCPRAYAAISRSHTNKYILIGTVAARDVELLLGLWAFSLSGLEPAQVTSRLSLERENKASFFSTISYEFGFKDGLRIGDTSREVEGADERVRSEVALGTWSWRTERYLGRADKGSCAKQHAQPAQHDRRRSL
jgi:hypothetical protein